MGESRNWEKRSWGLPFSATGTNSIANPCLQPRMAWQSLRGQCFHKHKFAIAKGHDSAYTLRVANSNQSILPLWVMSKLRSRYLGIYCHGNNQTNRVLWVGYGQCLTTDFKEQGTDSLFITLFWVQEHTELLWGLILIYDSRKLTSDRPEGVHLHCYLEDKWMTFSGSALKIIERKLYRKPRIWQRFWITSLLWQSIKHFK